MHSEQLSLLSAKDEAHWWFESTFLSDHPDDPAKPETAEPIYESDDDESEATTESDNEEEMKHGFILPATETESRSEVLSCKEPEKDAGAPILLVIELYAAGWRFVLPQHVKTHVRKFSLFLIFPSRLRLSPLPRLTLVVAPRALRSREQQRVLDPRARLPAFPDAEVNETTKHPNSQTEVATCQPPPPCTPLPPALACSCPEAS